MIFLHIAARSHDLGNLAFVSFFFLDSFLGFETLRANSAR